MFEQMQKAINSSSTILITTHFNPDADGIGAELALAGYLRSIGKTVLIANPDPLPSELMFLDPEKSIGSLREMDLSASQFDLIMPVDTAVVSRFSSEVCVISDIETGVFHAVDHHVKEEGTLPGTILSGTSSAGEIIYLFLKETAPDFIPECAEKLLYAIGSDTGWFQFANTTPEILRTAAELAEVCGIRIEEAYDRLKNNWSADKFKLWIDILSLTEITDDGIAIIRCDTSFADPYPSITDISTATDSFINDLKRLAPCNVFLFMRQTPEKDGYRVSLRSKDGIDVQEVARKFGGGGHKAASGCTISISDFEEARSALLNAIQNQTGQKS